MNKRALLGKILFVVIILAVLFISLSAYIKFSKDNVEITTGDVTINIDYNNNESSGAQDSTTLSPPTISPPTNQTNPNLTNLTYTNQTNQSQQYLNKSLVKE